MDIIVSQYMSLNNGFSLAFVMYSKTIKNESPKIHEFLITIYFLFALRSHDILIFICHFLWVIYAPQRYMTSISYGMLQTFAI